MTEQIRVEADPEALESLRAELLAQFGDELDMQEISSMAPGELREPILIGLVIALGGPKLVAGVVDAIDRWLRHRERTKALDMRFALLREKAEPVTLDELRTLSADE